MPLTTNIDEFPVENVVSANFQLAKESPQNLRLRNPTSAMDDVDVEENNNKLQQQRQKQQQQQQDLKNNDSKRRFRSNTTVCCHSYRRNFSQIIKFLSPCLKLANRHRKKSIILSLTIGIIVYLHFKQLHMRYMGKHPLHGGRIGQRIDGFFVRQYAKSVYERRKNEFEESGVDFPDLSNVGLAGILELRSNDALRETIIRAESNTRELKALEILADDYQYNCLSDNKRNVTYATELPRHIFVPDHHALVYPVPNYLRRIPFREANMRSFVKSNYNSLLPVYDSLENLTERTNFWGLVTIYHFGGVYIGSHSHNILETSTNILQSIFQDHSKQYETNCQNPTAIIIFASPSIQNNSFTNKLPFILATPRHPFLKCVFDRLASRQETEPNRIMLELIFGATKMYNHEMEGLWKERTIQDISSCSVTTHHGMIDSIQKLSDRLKSADTPSRVFSTILYPSESSTVVDVPPKVHISEDSPLDTSKQMKKQRLRQIMRNKRIEPGWMCARCLRAPILGTLQKCSILCPKAYTNMICSKTEGEDDAKMHDVNIHIGPRYQEKVPKQPRIPRIVHQTWFEEVSLQEYPQLARLQNSWISSGWEYRFYDDSDARGYIEKNFPSHFGEAYDAIVPGAFKADFFRYLVLMKDGGVYADIDILLETNLDSFVAPNLSFFAPRDVVCEYADEAFCLWNGIMGSAPGHPAIIRAAENTLNLINYRADFYDIESELCKKNGIGMEFWKYRSEPSLALSGPCALGIAVNEALNRTSLKAIPFGLLKPPAYDDHYGDVLILVGDKNDLGSFRFSDPERTIILGSTDLDGLEKKARKTKSTFYVRPISKEQKGQFVHYSETQKQKVWGEELVYHDDFVVDKVVRLKAIP